MPSHPAQVGFAMDRAASVPAEVLYNLPIQMTRSVSATLDYPGTISAKSKQSGDIAGKSAWSFSPASQKSVGSMFRANRSYTPDLWRNSAVSDSISSRHDIQALRDLCGPDISLYLDSDELKHVKVLGEGAYAEVSIAEYQGPDLSLPPTQVAIKRLKDHSMKSEGDVLDFIEEVRVLHRLNHPNIVGFVGFGCLDTSSREAEWRTIFLVQEYMKGGTLQSAILRQMIDRSTTVYTYAQGLRWCLGAASALAVMHGSEPMVIHRDLKSENILLTDKSRDSVAKVADLGLHAIVQKRTNSLKNNDKLDLKQTKNYEVVQARLARTVSNALGNGQAAIEAEAATTFWKMTGKTGSYVYMAPEILHGKPYNESVDVFSMGIIVFEVFSKRVIGADYMNTTQWDESEAHAERVAAGWRPPFPERMPENIRKLVDRCWSGVPALRPSMAEVVSTLEEIGKSGIVEEMDAAEIKAQGCACSIM